MKYSSYKWHNKSFIQLLFSSGRCFSRFSSYLLNGFQWHQPESQSDGANHHSIKIESMADGLLSASRSFHHKHDDVGVITESCTVYHRRWYILVVFSLIAGVQAAVWNTWGPITGSAEDVFWMVRWDNSVTRKLGANCIYYIILGVFLAHGH